MYKQLINKENGQFTVNNDFIVSNKTTLTDLFLYFGKDQLIQSKYMLNYYYTASQFENDNLFFKFSFTIENMIVKRIGFEIEIGSKPRSAWGNNRDVETAWIANQMNDTTSFDWDNNHDNKQYILSYNWGDVGVTFDFKNGMYESFLNYKSNN
jgi:hypothetical protein